MPGFANYDAIINALTTGKGQQKFFQKASITSVAAFWYRLWNAAGMPGAGVDPTPALQGQIPARDIAGALAQNNPISPATLHMLSFGAGGGTQGTLMIYDRLLHIGGISLTVNTLQTFTGTLAPSRHSDGIGNLLLLEITTASSATASTFTVTYTNEHDVTGRVATLVGGLIAVEPVNRCYFLALQAGDHGVKSVQSCQLGTAKTGGVANLIILNAAEIVCVPWVANSWTERDLVLQMANLPRILDDACLALMVLASTTSTGMIYGRLVAAEG